MSGGVKSFAPFESAQIQALIPLAKDIIARYDIKPQNVVAHADIAPQRKDDPGPRFPWRELAAQGIAPGLTPSVWRLSGRTRAVYASRYRNDACVTLALWL
ncbi:N-acetylmuramoyl-L-alanine amidase [Salmonella enterica subsp. diarizonae]|uniref:N-acetylmuramoyl-L-alanine amidase n=1 Tax=Salmonella diarizonae TaxID=59204 RepID=A0A379U482_SALDZ|nr:N-acetylmuramoyl-L-alanine amidase [Salmonella enterica subsp. diarizonae]